MKVRVKLTPERLTIFAFFVVIALIFFCYVVEAKTYYTYEGNVTKELYIGGELHFPKSIADKIRVSGGVIEKETEKEWIIKVARNTVVVEYIKLTNDSFSYGKKTYSAKEFPVELYNPVKPEELRLTLKQIEQNYKTITKELTTVKTTVKAIADRPTFSEQLIGFFIYNPIMIVVYIVLAFFGFLALIGWKWG